MTDVYTSWRAAHHWLRGWSDKLAGRDLAPLDPLYADDYLRGYSRAITYREATRD